MRREGNTLYSGIYILYVYPAKPNFDWPFFEKGPIKIRPNRLIIAVD